MTRATFAWILALTAQMASPFANAVDYRDEVLAILESKCASCHGEFARAPAFASLPLVRFFVQKYTEDKVRLALSRFQIVPEVNRLSVSRRAKYRKALARVVTEKRMPPRLYLVAHPGSRLTTSERDQILAWASQD